MGYSTDFNGRFEFDRPPSEEHVAYLRKFAETRRMRRNAAFTAQRPDPIRKAVGLPVGVDGGYFVGGGGFAGQERSSDVTEYNGSPQGQPGLWCKWAVSEDGKAIEWDGAEKFYYYADWLDYIIGHFIEPWGYKLTGEVHWQGEDRDDNGTLLVIENKLTVLDGNQSSLYDLAIAAIETTWKSYAKPEYWGDEDEDY